MSKAWEVIILLYNWPLSKKKPGLDNSKRMITERLEPKNPDQKPKIKYKLPISLWLVLSNQEKKLIKV